MKTEILCVAALIGLVWLLLPTTAADQGSISFVSKENITAATKSPTAIAYANGKGASYIQEGLPRAMALEACWHENQHNTLCIAKGSRNCSIPEQHEIIRSKIPNFFDKKCLFLWWI